MLYHGTALMKAENSVVICVHRGTTVDVFTALWHLTMKSTDGGAWWMNVCRHHYGAANGNRRSNIHNTDALSLIMNGNYMHVHYQE